MLSGVDGGLLLLDFTSEFPIQIVDLFAVVVDRIRLRFDPLSKSHNSHNFVFFVGGSSLE